MYQLAAPASPLRPFIQNYWFLRLNAGNVPVVQESIFVDGCADLIFNFGSAYQRHNLTDPSSSGHLAVSNLDAQHLYPVAIAQQGEIHLIGVRFRPGGLAAFLSVPMHRISDLAVDLADGVDDHLRTLEGQLYDTHTVEQQLVFLDAYFLRRMTPPPNLALAQQAALRLSSDTDSLSIQQLADELGCSIRTLNRYFQQHLGFSPKQYARIVRFQEALRQLAEDSQRSLALIAAGCGYFDQSHFTHEFRSFTGQTPESYRLYLQARRASPPPNLVQILQEESPQPG
ncbi:helix-turn-helix domain-containing protein [bacterium]|nr:helix-turn-helix domain-containing protein [bacterium]